MKTLLAALALGLAVAASSQDSRLLERLEPIEHRSIVCGCRFNAVGESGGFYSGPELLALDPNGEPPNARVNIGEGNVLLRPAQTIEFPLYQCQVGEIWTSKWLSEVITVTATLNALKPGAEACWFEGTVETTVSDRTDVVPVNGACGC